MSGSASNSSTRTGVFTVTVSGDPRFIPTIRLLTSKAAEADGCSEASAGQLADAVSRILALGLGGEPPEAGRMELQFEPTSDAFCVEIRVPARLAVEGGLERSLDAVRGLVSSAELAAAGAHQICRIACRHSGSS